MRPPRSYYYHLSSLQLHGIFDAIKNAGDDYDKVTSNLARQYGLSRNNLLTAVARYKMKALRGYI